MQKSFYKDKEFLSTFNHVISKSLDSQKIIYWKIITNWHLIVSTNISENTRVLKLIKKKNTNDLELIIECFPQMKLELQHYQEDILSKINTFLGGNFITNITIRNRVM